MSSQSFLYTLSLHKQFIQSQLSKWRDRDHCYFLSLLQSLRSTTLTCLHRSRITKSNQGFLKKRRALYKTLPLCLFTDANHLPLSSKSRSRDCLETRQSVEQQHQEEVNTVSQANTHKPLNPILWTSYMKSFNVQINTSLHSRKL